MKIKAFILLLLALCVISLGTLPVFAEASTGGSVGIQVSTEIVNYPEFSVSIPSVIPIGEIQKTAEPSIQSTPFSIEITDLESLEGQRVDVTLLSPDGAFYLSNGVYRIPYEIFNQESGGEALESGDLFASFTQSGEIRGRVEVDRSQIPAEGSYAATIQFVVELKALEKNQ